MQKYILSFIVVWGWTVFCQAQVSSPKVLKILDAQTEAMGGEERIRSLRTLQYKTQDSSDSSGYHEIWHFARDGAVRNDRVSLSSRKETYSIVVSSADAWEGTTSDDPTEAGLSVSAIDMRDTRDTRGQSLDRIGWLKQQISDIFVSFRDRIENGYKYELLGRRNGPTGVEYVIKEIWPAGTEREIYITRETNLISCRQQQPYKDGWHGLRDTEECYTGYKLIDGYLLPSIVARKTAGDRDAIADQYEIVDYKVNPDLDHKIFERPNEKSVDLR